MLPSLPRQRCPATFEALAKKNVPYVFTFVSPTATAPMTIVKAEDHGSLAKLIP
jgi:hypothetical protein